MSSFPRTRIRVNDVELAVSDVGDGPSVLLLHGFPDTAEVWKHQVPALVASGFRVIAPDLRGFGESERPLGVDNYRPSTIRRDLVGLLDALDLERAAVVAHDVGCAPAWGLGALAPDRVDRLVVMSTGHGVEFLQASIEQRRRSWYIAFFQFVGVAEDALRRDDWSLFREWAAYRDPVDIDHAIRMLERPGALTAALSWYRAMLPPEIEFGPVDLRAGKAVVPVPTLGIYGELDPYLTSEQMRRSGAHVSGPWACEIIDDAGHWIQLDAPERVNELLLGFLGTEQFAAGPATPPAGRR